MGVIGIVYNTKTGEIVYHQQVPSEQYFWYSQKLKEDEKVIFVETTRDIIDVLNVFTSFRLLQIEEYLDDNNKIQTRLVISDAFLSRFPLSTKKEEPKKPIIDTTEPIENTELQ